jgi:hypothetical protein
MAITQIRIYRNYSDAPRVNSKIYNGNNQESTWTVAHDLNGWIKVDHFDTLSSAKNFRKALIKKRDNVGADV